MRTIEVSAKDSQVNMNIFRIKKNHIPTLSNITRLFVALLRSGR